MGLFLGPKTWLGLLLPLAFTCRGTLQGQRRRYRLRDVQHPAGRSCTTTSYGHVARAAILALGACGLLAVCLKHLAFPDRYDARLHAALFLLLVELGRQKRESEREREKERKKERKKERERETER